MKYNYNWKLTETSFKKNKGKVFSCFACGGGSSMGYKLAGFDVVGFNEIDPRMANLYIKNHKPNNVLFADFPKLNMSFSEKEIPFKEIKTTDNNASWTDHDQYIWNNRRPGDKKYADVLVRVEDRYSNFNASFIYNDRAVSTISSSEGSKLTLFDEPRKMNTTEMIKAQSFPLDYDFGSDKANKIQYVLGMSVPPVMMAQIAERIHSEWRCVFT